MGRFLFEKFDARTSFWIIVILSAFIAVVFQGSRGLFETTEGRYAECAREMLIQGNFLVPTLDFQTHWTKPPLTYWAIAVGIALLGRNEWGVRACLVVAFCLTVAVLYSIASLVWGKEVAPYSAIVYMTSFFPAYAANVVSSDMLLSMWEALAIWGFWAGIRSHKKSFFTLMWLFLGAAFLTKGPPALIPLFVLFPIYGLMRQKKWDVPSIFTISGILLFITVGLGWYLYEAWLHPGLLSYWIKHEVAGHLVTNEYARNTHWYKAILIYWPVLIFGALPWTGLLILKRKQIPWPGKNWLHADYWGNRIEWSFVGLSIFLPLLIFSLSRSRLPLYILPLFIPLSLAIGQCLHGLVLNQKIELYALKRFIFFALIIIVAGKGVAANIHSPKDMRQLAGKITPEISNFPHRHLYFVGDGLLYGLEFYLNSLLVRVSLAEPVRESTIPIHVLSEVLNKDCASGIVPFILVRNKDIPKLKGIIQAIGSQGRVDKGEEGITKSLFGEHEHQVKKLTDSWTLISWKGED